MLHGIPDIDISDEMHNKSEADAGREKTWVI